MKKNYRAGAVGAMMDELERAMNELVGIVQPLSKEEFERVRDSHTQDENCRSIQTIVSHVISAGHGYANYIREVFLMSIAPFKKRPLSVDEVPARANEMLQFTADTLEGHWKMDDAELQGVVITSRWGTRYDLEQILEHAIVHVLRHRRQIERWLM
jgi:uncharacterized damage-inducible protein DinB